MMDTGFCCSVVLLSTPFKAAPGYAFCAPPGTRDICALVVAAAIIFCLAFCLNPAPVQGAENEYRIVKSLEVGESFSGTRVRASLLTHGERQYVAYYDAEQQVVIAERKLGSGQWAHRRLPLNLRWNNHRAIKGLAVCSGGFLHISGNMHADPLVYWRTSEPHDSDRLDEEGIDHIDTLEEINHMVGEKENSVTYERFNELPDGRFVFSYRYGGSGRGETVINVWDPDEKSWSRLQDQPLFDGLGKMNAYGTVYGSAIRGPDGNFHRVFMWRESPDARTNRDLSYVWSEDLKNYRTAAGEPLDLPITPETEAAVVDPVEPGKGLINMGFSLGFDSEKRPILSYHKYDEDGKSQIYNARWEEDRWEIYQTSEWEWRWDFAGRGAIPCKVRAGEVRPEETGFLSQPYSHEKFGSGVWKLDAETLKPVGTLPPREQLRKPGELRKLRDDFEHEDGSRMHVQWAGDLGSGADTSTSYYLRWESLPTNRDAPRKGELPDPSPLELYKLQEPRGDG